MGRLKSLAGDSLAYGVSSLVSRFLNFLLVPFYTHVLTPGEFGVTNIVLALVAFLNIVYQAGFDSSYLRLAHDADDEERKRLFSTALWSQAGISALLTGPLILAAPWLGEAFGVPVNYSSLFAFSALILALDALSVVPMAHLRWKRKALAFAGVRLANVIVNIAGNLVFVLWLKRGLEGVFLANALASASTLLLLSPVFAANLRAPWRAWDTARVRALLAFGLPFVPAGLYGIVNEMAGRLFLSRLSQADVDRLHPGAGWDVLHLTGVFSAAWKLGVFGLLLVQMYRLAWQPFFLRHHRDPDAPALFGRVLRALLLFIGACGLALMLFLDKLAAFPIAGRPFIAAAYWEGLRIVPGVLLAYALQAWCVHFTLGVYIEKRTAKLAWINGAGALVTVAASLWLVPSLGLWGAVWAAVACYGVMAVLMTRASQRLYRIELEWPRLLPLFAWMALCFAGGFWVQFHPDTAWGLRWGLLFAGLAVPFVIGAVGREERKVLRGLIFRK